MGLVVSSPSYMYQSPSGYIFRIRVQSDLRELVPIVSKINFSPFTQGSCNSRTETMIWQQSLGNIGDQDRIADIRVTSLDLLNGQGIWEVIRADNFNSIVKDESLIDALTR